MKIGYKGTMIPLVVFVVPLLHGCGGSSTQDTTATSDTTTTSSASKSSDASTAASDSTQSASTTSDSASSGGTSKTADAPKSSGDSGSSTFAADKVPSTDALETLTKDSLLDFADAVKAKDFTKFQSHMAKQAQEQITPTALSKAFKPFTEQGFDISGPVKNLKPVFTPEPAIEDGTLIVKGNYPIQPSQLNFELKYMADNNAWKLVGINVKAHQAPAAASKDPSTKSE